MGFFSTKTNTPKIILGITLNLPEDYKVEEKKEDNFVGKLYTYNYFDNSGKRLCSHSQHKSSGSVKWEMISVFDEKENEILFKNDAGLLANIEYNENKEIISYKDNNGFVWNLEEYNNLDNGEVIDIFGEKIAKGKFDIDGDVTDGYQTFFIKNTKRKPVIGKKVYSAIIHPITHEYMSISKYDCNGNIVWTKNKNG